MTIAGGKLVEVGDEFRGCSSNQIKDAINDHTAAIHYMAHGPTGDFASPDCIIVSLEEVIEVAHDYNLPVLVDAAFQCFPKSGLKKFTARGADAVAYSCKYFGGPNTAGILLGKKKLIENVVLHSFIGQEGGQGGEILLEASPDKPHGSVFRGNKMDRASIAGAVASLEEHLATDYEEIFLKAKKKIKAFK